MFVSTFVKRLYKKKILIVIALCKNSGKTVLQKKRKWFFFLIIVAHKEQIKKSFHSLLIKTVSNFQIKKYADYKEEKIQRIKWQKVSLLKIAIRNKWQTIL